jgi:hypothetical protein
VNPFANLFSRRIWPRPQDFGKPMSGRGPAAEVFSKMNRRQALKVLGAVTGLGVAGRYALLPPPRSRKLDPAANLAIRFFETLDAKERKGACVAFASLG